MNQYISFGGKDGQTVSACVRPRDIEGFRSQYGGSNNNSPGEKDEEVSSRKESSGQSVNNGPGAIGDQMFAVRSHRTGDVVILRLPKAEVALTRKDWDVFTITPVFESFRQTLRKTNPSKRKAYFWTSVPATPEILSDQGDHPTENSIESGA